MHVGYSNPVVAGNNGPEKSLVRASCYNGCMRTFAGECTYAETLYANPHAPTAYFNGMATTTYAYDANGNLTQSVISGTTTTYLWVTSFDVSNSFNTSVIPSACVRFFTTPFVSMISVCIIVSVPCMLFAATAE
jgi:YD repeat-containing protein